MNGFFSLNRLMQCLTVALACYATQALADNDITNNDKKLQVASTKKDKDEKELATINVLANRLSKENGVTGLGEINKSAAKLAREQVENIRDLVRYDPNIGVSEAGGRGTTRGFAMRGVDQDRVATSVDGLSDISPFKRDDRYNTTGSRTSAAINEVEYENIKEVDIQKGSASAEYGSGALGGAVSSTTKDINDFLKPKQKLGGRIKVGGTSQNKGYFSTIAVAGRAGDIDGFVQYTYRKNHETQAHSDLYRGQYFIPTYAEPKVNGIHGYWVPAKEVSGSDPSREIRFDNHQTVLGVIRKVPNPQDIFSKSLLSKIGWHINSAHYLGIVIDNSDRQYTTRDMLVPNYWGANEKNEPNGVIFGNPDLDRLKYTPTRFYIDHHISKRVGLVYQYINKNKNNYLPDDVSLSFNHRNFELLSTVLRLNCSKWPSVNMGCWAKKDLASAGQISYKNYVTYQLDNNQLNGKVDKKLYLGQTSHQLKFSFGYLANRHNISDEAKYLRISKEVDPSTHQTKLDIKDTYSHLTAGPIYEKNLYVGLSDIAVLSPQWQTSLALRYDYSKFKAHPTDLQKQNGTVFEGSHFNHLSWDFGVRYAPFEHFNFLYRISSGFRDPSVFEQLGASFAVRRQENRYFLQENNLRPEKSLNNEIGVEFHNDIFRVKASYFITKYKDLIGYYTELVDKTGQYQLGKTMYFNGDPVKVHGYYVTAILDGHRFWDKLPEGLEIFARIGQTKGLGSIGLDKRFGLGRAYSLDAIQPLRLVYGIRYTDLYDKWGINFTTTFSQDKDPGELLAIARSGQGDRVGNNNGYISRSWARTDITGHYRFAKHWVVRAGIYNIFNQKYSTWESIRQFSYGLEARLGTPDYRVVTAPGINFLLSVEAKF